MLTGHHPWNKFSEVAALYKIGTLNAPHIPDRLSSEAKAFIQRCFIL